MDRKQLLKIVNVALALIFLDMAITGSFPDLFPRNVYHVIHEEMGKVFIFFVLFHLALNWNWVKNTLLKSKKSAA
ncbi:MAG: hypothetical protein WA947_03520 [Phormidesmis sp.]